MTEAQSPTRARPMPLGHPFYALVEMFGGDPQDDAARFERALIVQLGEGVIADAVIAKSGREREALWAVREDMQPGLAPLRPFTVCDVSMTLQHMPEFAAKVRERVSAAYPGARLFFYGHAGDGNLHLIVHTGPDGEAHADSVESLVYRAVNEVSGSIAAEHGIGTSRAPYIGLIPIA